MMLLGHHGATRTELAGLCCSRVAAEHAPELDFSSRLTRARRDVVLLVLARSPEGPGSTQPLTLLSSCRPSWRHILCTSVLEGKNLCLSFSLPLFFPAEAL